DLRGTVWALPVRRPSVATIGSWRINGLLYVERTGPFTGPPARRPRPIGHLGLIRVARDASLDDAAVHLSTVSFHQIPLERRACYEKTCYRIARTKFACCCA